MNNWQRLDCSLVSRHFDPVIQWFKRRHGHIVLHAADHLRLGPLLPFLPGASQAAAESTWGLRSSLWRVRNQRAPSSSCRCARPPHPEPTRSRRRSSTESSTCGASAVSVTVNKCDVPSQNIVVLQQVRGSVGGGRRGQRTVIRSLAHAQKEGFAAPGAGSAAVAANAAAAEVAVERHCRCKIN